MPAPPLRPFPYGVDLIRDQAMCFTVHGGGSFGVWRIDEAEDLPLALIDPVTQIGHAVPFLRLDVSLVRSLHIVECRAFGQRLMHVHE